MRLGTFCIVSAAIALAAGQAAGQEAADLTSCDMTFELSGWSLGYKHTKGKGRVTCSNGQTADVKISSHGAGATVSKSDIVGGKGSFSEVKDISEVFGTYAQAEASGGAVKGGGGQVLTKGEISLAISGSGRGWEAGATIGGLSIKPIE